MVPAYEFGNPNLVGKIKAKLQFKIGRTLLILSTFLKKNLFEKQDPFQELVNLFGKK